MTQHRRKGENDIMRKKEGEKKTTEATLLQELCGADAELYACLSIHLYETPLAAISQKDLEILIAEAEESGDYRRALDKAIFEGARDPAARARYVEVIQNLALKTVGAMERERETAEKKGLTDLAASLGRGIKNQRLMSERADDVLNVASQFYKEKLLALDESARREARGKSRQEAEREEKRILESEAAERKERREKRKGMGWAERREAKRQERRERLAAEKRKDAREEERQEAAQEEKRIGEQEQVAREERREERRES